MKKIISIFLSIFTMMMLILPCSAVGVKEAAEKDVFWLADGGYVEIITESCTTFAFGTITKSKHYIRHNGDGDTLWDAKLTGTFTYDGTTSSCTNSSCSVAVYRSNWYVVSKSATKSGNTAYATVTMGRKVLGVTVDKETFNITLKCDKDGNVS